MRRPLIGFASRFDRAEGVVRATSPGRLLLRVAAVALVLPFAACKVGPDFTTPTASVADKWLESGDPSVQSDHQEYEDWWTVFHDPTLNRLVDIAYHQNLTLMAAGARVLEARAILGVSI